MMAPETEELTECMICGGGQIEVADSEAALCICNSCGYVFDSPRPTLDAIISFYSTPAKYDSWLSEEGARAKLWTRRLKKMRRVARPGTLLDVGAGIGQFLHLARRDFTETCGTEVSSSAVAIAQNKYGLQLLHGTLGTLSLPPESFDNITAFHVLEHVPNPKAMIGECRSLLRENGVLVIAVPNDYRPVKSMLRLRLGQIGVSRYRAAARLGLRRIRLDGSMEEIHLSHFTPKVLRYLLEDSGFRILNESVDPYYTPAAGLAGLKQAVRYLSGLFLHALVHVNVYDTIWMVAEKR